MEKTPATDVAAWVQAARQGSADGFACLHRQFVGLVHGILLTRFRPAIADELTQECFLIAYRQLDQLREPEKFAPWIVAIARRLDARDDAHGSIDDLAEERADPGASPEAMVDAARVIAALRDLPEAYRETLVLRLVEGLSGAEIAAVTELSPESVRVNLHRGMKKLREVLSIDIEAAS